MGYRGVLLLAFALATPFHVHACERLLTRPYSPVRAGQEWVVKHPHYERLVRVARGLGIGVEWVDDTTALSKLKVRGGERIEAFFLSDSSAIHLDRRYASLATLVHELRHARQLRNNPDFRGTSFDVEVQSAATEAEALKSEVGSERIRALVDSVVGAASEISAYYHDGLIAARRGAPAKLSDSRYMRARYRRQFVYAYRQLKQLGIVAEYPFLDRLNSAMETYYEFTKAALLTAAR